MLNTWKCWYSKLTNSQIPVKPEIRKLPRYSKFAVNQMHQVGTVTYRCLSCWRWWWWCCWRCWWCCWWWWLCWWWCWLLIMMVMLMMKKRGKDNKKAAEVWGRRFSASWLRPQWIWWLKSIENWVCWTASSRISLVLCINFLFSFFLFIIETSDQDFYRSRSPSIYIVIPINSYSEQFWILFGNNE